ncbi:hypothetical protein QE152_g34307 [Popillia japonica]|uniref:Uncharacterized protein n=1 Tax=Popillia japonica TaxID=7064 RepID=A0AAW1IU07_POPJA
MSNDDVNSSPQSSVNEPVGESKPKLTLDFLVKLIPNNFDGDSLYQDKKSIDQLLEELSNIKQQHSETFSQFYQRPEDLSSRILAIVHTIDEGDEGDKNLKGRLLMIGDMTLNRFIYHTHPNISQMLRYRQFSSINEALTAAIAEEKVLKLVYKPNQY